MTIKARVINTIGRKDEEGGLEFRAQMQLEEGGELLDTLVYDAYFDQHWELEDSQLIEEPENLEYRHWVKCNVEKIHDLLIAYRCSGRHIYCQL